MAVSDVMEAVVSGASTAAQTVSDEIPLWALIVTVIGGTVILVVSVVFLSVLIRRSRRRRLGQPDGKIAINGHEMRSPSGPSTCGSEDVWGGTSRKEGRRKLRKRNRNCSRGSDVSEGDVGFHDMSSPVAKTGSVPVLPRILKRTSSLFSLGSVARDNDRMSTIRPGPGSRRRTSNAWVDEDALHGPVMSPGSDEGTSPTRDGGSWLRRSWSRASWRKIMRESWPLKTVSPTLPSVTQFGPFVDCIDDDGEKDSERPDSVAMFRYSHRLSPTTPSLAVPRSMSEQASTPQYSPPRQLPKPPNQALLAASTEAAGSAHDRLSSFAGARSMATIIPVPPERGLSYYTYEDSGRRLSGSNQLRVQPGVVLGPAFPVQRGRRTSATDSTLSEILKGTEKRLAEGTVTGVLRRNQSTSRTRLTSSPTKKNLGANSTMSRDKSGSLSLVTGGTSSVTLVGSVSRTPSPPKHKTPAAPTHLRHDSQNSIASEADSIFANPSPVLEYHALTSPARSNKPQQQQQQQPPLTRKRSQTDTESIASSMSSIEDRSLSTIDSVDENADDAKTTAPNSSIPTGMNAIAGYAPDSSLDDPFLLNMRPNPSPERTPALSELSQGFRRSGHAFNDAPRLSGGPTTPTELMLYYNTNDRSESALSPISGNGRSSVSPTRSSRSSLPRSYVPRSSLPRPIAPATPMHKTTATFHAVASPADNSSLVAKRIAELRERSSSPTLGFQQPLPPLPPPPLPAPLRLTNRDSTPDMMIPPGPALNSLHDMIYSEAPQHQPAPAAAAAPAAAVDSSPSTSTYSFERDKTDALNRLSAIVGSRRTPSLTKSRTLPSISPTVRIVPPEDHKMQVSTTVAQLRRMNSQISGYSDGSSEAGPPAVSVGGNSSSINGNFSSSRRDAARNYLALGDPPPPPAVMTSRNNNNNNKENERRMEEEEVVVAAMTGALGLKKKKKMPKMHEGGGGGGGVSFTPRSGRRRARVENNNNASPERRSEDSLGLYDADGFLISPEKKLAKRRI